MGHFHRAKAGIDHLERLSRGSSPIHILTPLSKLMVTFLFIVLVVSCPLLDIERLAPFFLYPSIMMALSGTPFRPLLRRFYSALPFVLAAGISNIIIMRAPLFDAGGFIITSGMVSSAVLILKTALAVFAVLLLIATTPFTDIAALLTGFAPLRIFGLQIALTHRYISVLLEEAGDAWTAYHLRSPYSKGIRLKDIGSFLGGLLLRSVDRAERVYAAMKCRGWQGAYHSIYSSKFSGADAVFIAASVIALVSFRLFNISALLGGLVT